MLISGAPDMRTDPGVACICSPPHSSVSTTWPADELSVTYPCGNAGSITVFGRATGASAPACVSDDMPASLEVGTRDNPAVIWNEEEKREAHRKNTFAELWP